MFKSLLVLFSTLLFSCSNTYYIVRHAEKEAVNEMTTDVLLSEEGRERAETLRDSLLKKEIKRIFSTNTLRTISTARPLSEALNVEIEMYDAQDNSFVNQLKQIKRGNILVVGHSNTVDNLVNGLTGETTLSGDLPDSAYGDLFVVKRKGKTYEFDKKRFGD